MARYRDDTDHPALLNRIGKPNPTRQPPFGNRLYCLVWPENDVLKLGLSGEGGGRSGSATRTLRAYLDHEGGMPGRCVTWRGELPFMEGATWGDCQRFEMVVATALKRRIKASSASALGFEWLTRRQLEAVDWPEELGSASGEAITFSGLRGEVDWAEYTPALGTADARSRGPAQLNAHRAMRNKRGVCALKGCDAPLTSSAVKRGRFDYCSAARAGQDDGARG